jgi:deoxyadenosine/deoxycytidine kinase
VKTGIKVPIGSKAEKVKDNGSEDFEGSMFGDSQSEAPSMIEEEIPEKVFNKIDKLEEHTTKLNIDLKEKNEKIIELMGELEDVKIQVFARDKSVELQQKQIEELLEELRESKGFENDIKILMQKNMALDDENGRLKTELQ